MQGRQNLTNTERKGPHKSMHCKFCKPPGVITPEKPSGPLLETKTKVHLAHEAADLRLCNTSNEPGFPVIESEACICVLEGENSCPKCAPDKSRSPPKKKVCRCPKGAKPHPSMYLQTAPKLKKPKHEDNEFWWEKYSREHDLIAQETWKAYMAQRRKDKKLEKMQKRKKFASLIHIKTKVPNWYQKFSCQQMTYLEFLSTAIRLDSDENITDRTFFVLAGIGLFPRPKRKLLKKCLSYCHYNAIHFLTQLRMLLKDEDPLQENVAHNPYVFTWNEKLLMNCVCYLEFPAFLREIMDRLPPLPRPKLLKQIPYPVFPLLPKKKYDSPYEEPIWQDRLNWVEKMKIDRLNRCRAHMETKRVKIPSLALVRRPSLIDARPPFLSQIEANERASRRLVKGKEKKPLRKHPITTFNSAVDVTAIAGIEASEISATEKEDADDLCVFLRGTEKEAELGGESGGEEEPDFQDKEVKFLETPKLVETQVDRMKACGGFEDFLEDAEEIPFKTPPKTLSGTTIQTPCPPPYATPGPPATHFEKGKRELDIINEEICGFFPYVSSEQIVGEKSDEPQDNVELKLKSAARKLRELINEPEGEQETKKTKSKRGRAKSIIRSRRKSSQKSRTSRKSQNYQKSPKPKDTNAKKTKKGKKLKKSKKSKKPRGPESTKAAEATIGAKPKNSPDTKAMGTCKGVQTKGKKRGTVKEESDSDPFPMTTNVGDGEESERDEEEEEEEGGTDEKEVKTQHKFVKSKQKMSASILSDPDPDSDGWSTRPPCTPESSKVEETKEPVEVPKSKPKKERKFSRRSQKRYSKILKVKSKIPGLREEMGEYKKVARDVVKEVAKEVVHQMASDHVSLPKEKEEEKPEKPEKTEKTEEKEAPKNVFRGDVFKLVADIVNDLADEGFHCATFPLVSGHPDITQLITHLKGELFTKNLRENLRQLTRLKWGAMPPLKRFPTSELGLSAKKLKNSDWNDKKWISSLAKYKIDQFYFRVASTRAEFGMKLYKTLYQSYFGTDTFLNIFSSYMISKYEDALLRGAS